LANKSLPFLAQDGFKNVSTISSLLLLHGRNSSQTRNAGDCSSPQNFCPPKWVTKAKKGLSQGFLALFLPKTSWIALKIR
uniref:Uncharacterized protein n=1 Tax=Cyanoderma ruficeps TaxID=181631 RepID=A0A8C3QYQ3_9PASS